MAGKGSKKNPGMRIRNGKKRGEWAELCFAARAVRLGMRLSRPWGESAGYDFLVEWESGEFARVQVKSTMFREGGGYSCTLKNSRGPYRGNPFDFVAAYVIPEDVWYILPRRVVKGMWSVSLHPALETSKYGAYKEAWGLLLGERVEKMVGKSPRLAKAARLFDFAQGKHGGTPGLDDAVVIPTRQWCDGWSSF